MEEEVFYQDNTSSASPDTTPFSSVDNVGSQGSSEENAEEDSDDDIDKMLSELQGFQEELEKGKENHEENFTEDLPSKPLDQFRLSMAAMEESGDIDLDALLEDLCSMEKDINAGETKTESETSTDLSMVMANGVALPEKSNAPFSPKLKVSQDVINRLENVQEETKELTAEEQQEKIKAEKIRIAMDKLRQARVKKLIVKVYNDEDPTSKTLAIDQTWTAWEVCKKMMRKDDKEPDPYWVLVERLYDLGVERMLEDHESVVDVVSNWPWDSNNKLVITNKREKYALFRNPQLYLLSSDTSSGQAHLAEKSKGILIEEYCKKDAMRLPELDGVMSLKEGRKTWRKHYFALRASGIYFNPKGRTKTSKDLVCLIKFEHVFVFTALGFKKKHKSPTDYCLVLKHPQYHEIDSKAVICLCAEDQKTLLRWIVGIRLAKYGYRMIEDYNQTQEEIDKMAFTLDRNLFARSSSFTNGESRDVAPPQPKIEPPPQTEPVKDYKIKPRVPSERSRKVSKTRTGAAFAAANNKQPPKPKAIKNLFSDAWKKGTEVEAKEMEQGSPETPSTPLTPVSPRAHFSVSSDGSGAVTPDFDTQKSFLIDNIINENDEVQQGLFIDSNPIQRKSFSGTLERSNKQDRSKNAHVYSVVSKSSAAPTTLVQPPPISPQLKISDGSGSSQPPLYEEINVHLPNSSVPSPLYSTTATSQGQVPVAPPPPPLVMDKPDHIPPPPPPVMKKPNAFPPPPLMGITPDASVDDAVDDIDIPPPPPPVMEKPKMKASSVGPASTEVSAAPPPPPPKMSNLCHPSTGNAGIPAPPPPPPLPSMPLSCTSKAPVSVNKNTPPPPPVKQKPKMGSSSSSSSLTDSCGHNTPPPVAVKPKTKSQMLADDVFIPLAPPCNIPPPPAFQTSAPPPVAKKPKSRPKSTSPPPSVGMKTPPVPPPVAAKPKSSVKFSTSSVSEVEKDLAPPPPPVAAKPRSKSVGAKALSGRGPDKAVDIEMDFPPPPPEVLFQETLNRSLTMSSSRDSEYSQRRNSFGKLPPPLPKRDSSLANLEGHH